MRVTQDTPDPQWMTEADSRLEDWLDTMSRLPVILDAQQGKLDPVAIRRFILKIGKGVIEAFPIWLNNMSERVPAGYPKLELFLRANRLEERRHWEWWKDMARHWGVTEEDFSRARLNKLLADDVPIIEFSEELTRMSRDLNLGLAVGAVNFVVETSAAALTARVAAAMSARMKPEEYRWIQAHADGDKEHSADARELIKQLIAGSFDGQRAFKRVVPGVAAAFTRALDSAYSYSSVPLGGSSGMSFGYL